MSKNNNSIFFIGFIDALAAGILVPIVVFLIPTLSSNNGFFTTPHLHPAVITGIALSIYPLFQMFAIPFIGKAGDIYAKNKVLTFCLFGTLLANIISIVGILYGNLFIFLLGRAIDGATGGNVVLLQSLLAENNSHQNAEKFLGKLSGLSAIGFVFGPLLGGILLELSTIAPLVCMMILNLIGITLIRTIQYVPLKTKTQLPEHLPFKLSAYLKKRIAIYAVVFFCISLVVAHIGPYTKELFNFSPTMLGATFLLLGISLGVGQIFILPRISSRLPQKYIVYGALSVIFTILPLLAMLPKHITTLNVVFTLLLLTLVIICLGILQNIALGIIGDDAKNSDYKTSIFGKVTLFQTGSDFIARFSSGFLVILLGIHGPFILISILSILVMIAWFFNKKTPSIA